MTAEMPCLFVSPGSPFLLLEHVAAVVVEPALLGRCPVAGVPLLGELGVEEPAEETSAAAVPECLEGCSVDGGGGGVLLQTMYCSCRVLLKVVLVQ